MTTATLSFYRVQKTIQSKIDSVDLPTINWKLICFSGFFILFSLLVFYVWQISDLTKGSYLVDNYEKQINILSQENKELQISFAENSFLGQVLEKIHVLKFQKILSVKYIQIPNNLLVTVK